MLSSLAEIIKETHVVWLHKGRIEDDAHGVLVLPKDQSDELENRHVAWVERRFGFPVVIAILALTALLIAIVPS